MDTKALKTEDCYEIINGIQFCYTTRGSGPNTILFLPGALGNPASWFESQIEYFGNDYKIIGFHPRGYGKSRPPERDWPVHYLERDAEDAAALMSKLNIGSYIILGWCSGGVTGMILAARYPDRVEKLVIWGAYLCVTQTEVDFLLKIRDISTWSSWVRELHCKTYSEEELQRLWDELIQAKSRCLSERNGNVCEDIVKNVVCPTLIITATKDKYICEDHALNIKKNIEKSRLLHIDGPHHIHMACDEEFNMAVGQFLKVHENTLDADNVKLP